jgi:hypothetical protein
MEREKRVIVITIVHCNNEINWRESFEQLYSLFKKEKETLDQMLVFLGKKLAIEESVKQHLRIYLSYITEYKQFSYEKSFFRLKNKLLVQFQNKLTIFYDYVINHKFEDDSLIFRFINYLSISLEVKHNNKIVLMNN